MAAVVASMGIPPPTPPSSLTLSNAQPITGKSSTHPRRSHIPDTPPPSPKTDQSILTLQTHRQILLSSDASCNDSSVQGAAPIYAISAAELNDLYTATLSQTMPDADLLFPWLHGLNPQNRDQCAFFDQGSQQPNHQKRPPLSTTTSCPTLHHRIPYRSLTIVQTSSRPSAPLYLKGAVPFGSVVGRLGFLNLDPPTGICLRNFHIQAAKCATLGDFVVYADDNALATSMEIAQTISAAQKCANLPFVTFVLTDALGTVADRFPHLMARDLVRGAPTPHNIDFCAREREEMALMTTGTPIAPRVYIGNTTDSTHGIALVIDAVDYAPIRVPSAHHASVVEFPASGSVDADGFAVDDLISFCRWVETRAHRKRVLARCMDGYTETTLFALAYVMVCLNMSLERAYVHLHVAKRRNFFLFESDVVVLLRLEEALQGCSSTPKDPATWTHSPHFSGSLPSRILPHLYLGNIGHARNSEMLKAIGITRVLSIGESALMQDTAPPSAMHTVQQDGITYLMCPGIQDDGIDSLLSAIEPCLAFIDQGFQSRPEQQATLVHCRVGVSRSASICIAEVVRRKQVSLPFAYLFVRARRLSVIIQPSKIPSVKLFKQLANFRTDLRFMYELVKWEEIERQRVGFLKQTDDDNGSMTQVCRHWKRDMEWNWLAYNIAELNKLYCSA